MEEEKFWHIPRSAHCPGFDSLCWNYLYFLLSTAESTPIPGEYIVWFKISLKLYDVIILGIMNLLEWI